VGTVSTEERDFSSAAQRSRRESTTGVSGDRWRAAESLDEVREY